MKDLLVKFPELSDDRAAIVVSVYGILNPLIQDVHILNTQLQGTRAVYCGHHLYNPPGEDPNDFLGYQRHRICESNFTYRLYFYYNEGGDLQRTIEFTTKSGTYTKTITLSEYGGIQKFDLDMSDVTVECNEIYTITITPYSQYTSLLYAGEVYNNPDANDNLPQFIDNTGSTAADWNKLFRVVDALAYMTNAPIIGLPLVVKEGSGDRDYGLQLSTPTLFVNMYAKVIGSGGSCEEDHWQIEITCNGDSLTLQKSYFTSTEEHEEYIDLSDCIANQNLNVGDVVRIHVHVWSDCQYQLGGIEIRELHNLQSLSWHPIHDIQEMEEYLPGQSILKEKGLTAIRNNLEWLNHNREAYIIPTAPGMYHENYWSLRYDHKRPYLHAYAIEDVELTVYWWNGEMTKSKQWSLKKEVWDTMDMSSLKGVYTGTTIHVEWETDVENSNKLKTLFADDLGYPNVTDELEEDAEDGD